MTPRSRRWSRCPRRVDARPSWADAAAVRPPTVVTGEGREDPERALALAYAYLNRRELTETELSRHLERRGVGAGAAAAAICTLRDQGYLDDARFARLFTQDKRNLEQWGSERIRRALSERGIDRELIEAALSEIPDESELDRARALLRRRFPAPFEDARDRERALGVLLRKGFESELALEAVSGHGGDALP
jgi:regulatory protein